MVTPLRFRAVTSSPNGKCRSIFLRGGVVRSFLRISLSSTVEGDVLIFLRRVSGDWANTSAGQPDLPPRPLCLLGNLQLSPRSLCTRESQSAAVRHPVACGPCVRRRGHHLPRSLIFMTPLALELARRCLVSLTSLGATSMPWTAESTLVSGSDMMDCLLLKLL